MSTAERKNILGKYRLIAELGHGGMADVHLAVATGAASAQKLVVIKQLLSRMAQEKEFLTMFLDEGRLAVRLSHPNIVQTYEVGATEDQHFIVMEYLDGQPFNTILRSMRETGGLPLEYQLRILADVLCGLQYAHDVEDYDGTPLAIVHRDVTPQNIFITYDGQIKVVDFGIAKALHSSSETRTGVIKGKISYMSPEQSRSEPVDRRTDVFAVGVMMWEAITGQRLWKGLADVTILQRLMNSFPVASPRDFKPEVSDLVVEVCAKALAPLPKDRYATAADLQNGIEDILVEMGKRVSARDVGKFIAAHFAKNRARMRAIIEEQLQKSPSDAIELVNLDARGPVSSWLNSQIFSKTGVTVQVDHDEDGVPSSSAPNAPVSATLASGPAANAKRNPALVGGMVALGVAVISVGGWILHTSSSAAGTAGPVVVASTALPPAAVIAALPQTIHQHISVNAPEARIYFDDRLLGIAPFDGMLPRDSNLHLLRIEAPGYQTKTKTIPLATDETLDIELDKMDMDSDKPTKGSHGSSRSGGRSPSGASNGGVGGTAVPAETASPQPVKTSIALPPATPRNAPVITTTNPWDK